MGSASAFIALLTLAVSSPGTIAARVDCTDSPGKSYALYLPAAYSPERPWPVLYVLDAGGDGPGAAEVFRAGAERYGWVVASSNDAASGTADDPNPAALGAMWSDTHRRLRIDDRRVYLAGLSGTARAAVRLARESLRAVAGVLGAAAGFPPEGPPAAGDRFAWFGTAGRGDFNYDEVLALEASLEGQALPHHVELFDGGHGWPPPELAARALAWFDLQSMKSGTRPRDAAWVEAQWSEALARARAAESEGRLYEALRAYRAAAADFAGLRDAAPAAKKAAELGAKQAVQHDLAAHAERSKEERRALLQASFLLDATDPASGPTGVARLVKALHLAELKEKAAGARDPEERWSAKRVLAALWAQTAVFLPALHREHGRADRADFVLAVARAIEAGSPAGEPPR